MWWVSGVERKSQHGLQVCVPWWRYHGDPLLTRKGGATVMWRFQSCGGRETCRIIFFKQRDRQNHSLTESAVVATNVQNISRASMHILISNNCQITLHFQWGFYTFLSSCSRGITHRALMWINVLTDTFQLRHKNISLACHGSSLYNKKCYSIEMSNCFSSQRFWVNIEEKYKFASLTWFYNQLFLLAKMFCLHYSMVF